MQQEELIKEKVRLKALATDGSTRVSRKTADALSVSSNSDAEGDVNGRLRSDDGKSTVKITTANTGYRNWLQ